MTAAFSSKALRRLPLRAHLGRVGSHEVRRTLAAAASSDQLVKTALNQLHKGENVPLERLALTVSSHDASHCLIPVISLDRPWGLHGSLCGL